MRDRLATRSRWGYRGGVGLLERELRKAEPHRVFQLQARRLLSGWRRSRADDLQFFAFLHVKNRRAVIRLKPEPDGIVLVQEILEREGLTKVRVAEVRLKARERGLLAGVELELIRRTHSDRPKGHVARLLDHRFLHLAHAQRIVR